MTALHYSIQPATLSHINLAIDWAADEGWNPGLYDAAPFHAADPKGFLVGLLEGEPVAVISAVRYGKSFGFVGFYMVRPDLRGQGYGLQLWQAAMARLDKRLIGLDGVVTQQDNYRKSGFRLAHRNVRYQGVGGATSASGNSLAEDGVSLLSLPFSLLENYDRAFFAAPREDFLHHWIAQPGTLALGLCRAGQLTGYGVMRPCRQGYKIGPLFADTEEEAEALFCALVRTLDGNSAVFLDVPEINSLAVSLAQRHGMAAVFETARMYTGPAPAISINRTYGITSFELG